VPLDALAALEGQKAQEEQNQKLRQIEYKTVEIVSHLSLNDEMKAIIAQSGLISPLVQLLTRAGNSADTSARHIGSMAARTIALLAFNESNRDTIREVGGLEAVAYLLRTPTIMNSSSSRIKDKTQVPDPNEAWTSMVICNAVWALEILSFNGKNRDILLSNGGIPALISLLSCAEEEIQALAVRALRNLSSYVSIAQLFLVSNLGVKYLLDILYSCKNDFVLIHVLELIQNLVTFDATRKLIGEAITKPIMEKLKSQLWNRTLLQPLLVSLEMFLGN